MYRFVFLTMVFALVLASCKKEVSHPEPGNGNPVPMGELRIPDDFDWKTTRAVEVIVNGLENASDHRQTLYIESMNGAAFFKKRYAINENLNLRLEVPSDADQLNLRFGNLEKIIKIENNVARISFFTELSR